MSESKRYYWLKLNENFFDREEVKVIESMKNGKDYIIFYLKLLLKSIATEGVLRFRGIIPYTPEMLASITSTNIDTVRVAIDLFVKLGLMELWDDGTLFMVETQNMIGSETEWARRKRIQRNKIEELPSPEDNVQNKEDNVQNKEDNVQKMSSVCPTDIDIDIDKDIDIDIDIDKDKELDIKDTTTTTLSQKTINLIVKEWNKLGLQQLKGINKNTNRYSMLKARINEYSLDEVIQAIKNIDKSSFLKGQNKRGWVITFDWLIRPNNFIKVLEGNYTDRDEGGGRSGETRGQLKQDDDQYAGIGFTAEDLQEL